MYDTNFSPSFKVEYTIWIGDFVELLTKEDPRITHDLIWEEFAMIGVDRTLITQYTWTV